MMEWYSAIIIMFTNKIFIDMRKDDFNIMLY